MYRHYAAVLTAAAGLILVACSESSDSSPTSPMVGRATSAAITTCNARAFRDARGYARSYFAQPTQGAAVGLIDAMEAAQDPTRTERGLDLFNLAALGTDVVGTAATGSLLLNIVAACSDLGLSADIDWTGPLGPQGALAVVGTGSGNISDPVYAKDLFSAVAPPSLKSWSQWLRLPDAPGTEFDFSSARAVVYGAPFAVTSTLSPELEVGTRGFDWSVLPDRPFPFGLEDTDDGYFGICVASSSTERIQNNHSATITGVLGAYDPGDAPLELGCTTFTDDGQPVVTGLLRRAIDLLSPQPAYAAAVLGKKTGGTPGGFSRHFVVRPNALQVKILKIDDGTVGGFLNGSTGGVKVEVRTVPPPPSTTGVAVQLTEVTIAVLGNSGLPAQFSGDNTAITNEFGVATFTDLQLFSAGGYTLHAFLTDGLAGLPSAEGISNQFHIKNRRK